MNILMKRIVWSKGIPAAYIKMLAMILYDISSGIVCLFLGNISIRGWQTIAIGHIFVSQLWRKYNTNTINRATHETLKCVTTIMKYVVNDSIIIMIEKVIYIESFKRKSYIIYHHSLDCYGFWCLFFNFFYFEIHWTTF